MVVGAKGTCVGQVTGKSPCALEAVPSDFGCRGPLCPCQLEEMLPLPRRRWGGRGKKNQKLADVSERGLRNGMFSFLSNFNLSLTSLRSFPAALAPLRARPMTPRCGRMFSVVLSPRQRRLHPRLP